MSRTRFSDLIYSHSSCVPAYSCHIFFLNETGGASAPTVQFIKVIKLESFYNSVIKQKQKKKKLLSHSVSSGLCSSAASAATLSTSPLDRPPSDGRRPFLPRDHTPGSVPIGQQTGRIACHARLSKRGILLDWIYVHE